MSVELVITDPGYRSTLLDKWFEEDHYTQMNGVSHDINKKARVYPYIPSLEGSAEKRYIDFSLPIQGPIYIVYLDGRSDSGLPHTRGTSGIALPVFLLWNPSEKTLHHELVHISQKQVSKRWWNWYKIYWNFRPAKKEEFMMIPLKWRSRRRINPDLLGTPYTIWSDRYIPMSVFLFEKDPDLRECKRGFWDIHLSQWTWEEPPGWIHLFGSGFNDEHPHEIAAHWIDGSAGKERRDFFDINPV